MPASDVTIEEVSGANPLRIVLRGRALPYQGVKFSGQMRTATTWYPGNPKATQQVLGEELEDTELHGTWKVKFLREGTDYEVSGGDYFGGDLASENLVSAFELLRARGVQLRLTWGTIVRYGLLRNFEANWLREEDVEWTAEFEWNGTTEQLVRQGDGTVLGQSVLEDMQRLDDSATLIPQSSLAIGFTEAALAFRSTNRARTLQLLGAVRNVLTRTQTAAQSAQAMVSRATYLAADAIGYGSLLRDTNYVHTSLLDDVASVLRIEVWRLRMSSSVLRTAAAGAHEAQVTELSFQPPAQEVVVVRQRTTLRQLAITAYGDADAWQQIAAANRLPGSVVEAGQRVVIPRRTQAPTLEREVL